MKFEAALVLFVLASAGMGFIFHSANIGILTFATLMFISFYRAFRRA